MRKKTAAFIRLYSVLATLTLTVGLAIGELRVDLYVSMFILWFFVLTAVFGVKAKPWAVLLLLTVFFLLVGYRILAIIGGLP